MSRLIAADFAMVALVATPAAAAPKARATITLASHRFTPSPIYLAGGVPVRLILTNRAGKTHDFTAPQFFAADGSCADAPLAGRYGLVPEKAP